MVKNFMKISKKIISILLLVTAITIFGVMFANAVSSPEVLTDKIGSVSTNSATVFGKITYNNAPMVDFWFEYWPQDNYSNKQTTAKRTNFNSKITSQTPYVFAQNLGALDSGKVYCFRAIAQNSQGYAYGEEKCFTTANSSNIQAPIVKTLNPSVGNNYAILKGSVEKLANPSSASVSFQWYRHKYISNKYTTKIQQFFTTGEFSEKITGLIPNDFYCYRTKTTYIAVTPITYSGHSGYTTQYPYGCSGNNCLTYPQSNTYYQEGVAYASGGIQNYTIYGEEKCFTAGGDNYDDNNSYDKVSLGSVYASEIDSDSALLNAQINDLGDDTTAQIWFEYGKTSSYGNQTAKINTSNTGKISKMIYGLQEGQTYHFRAVAQNKNGTTYSSDKTFTADYDGNGGSYYKPEISTRSATNIEYDRATLNGYLYDLGNDDKADVWFEWKDYDGNISFLSIPTALADNGTTETISRYNTGSFSINLSGLESDRRYYFRAVARNSYGTTFSSWLSFYTDYNNDDNNHTRPIVRTKSATDTGYRYATLNGYLEDLGDDNYANTWFEYGRTSSYGSETERDNRNSTGNMTAYISGLEENVTYHFRAVAQNSTGKTYGSDYTFRTGDYYDNNGDNPIVRTKSATNITDYSAKLNGSIEDLGNDNEAQVWFEYGTSRSFGYATSRIWKSREEGFFYTVNNLDNNATYYFRAVIQNDYGKTYGSTYSFRTGDDYQNYDDTEDNYGTIFKNKELSIDIRTKNISQNGQYWSDNTNARPGEYAMFRIDVRNNKSSRANNVIVKTTLSPSIEYLGNVQMDGRILNGDIVNGINIGNIESKDIKTITFSAKIKDTYNFSYGQNDLVSVAYIKNSDPKIVESCKISVYRTAVSGINLNPSSVVTGIGDNLLSYILLPAILAIVCMVFFRKRLMDFFSRWDKSVDKAENRSSEKELDKKIQEMTNKQ